MCSRGFLCRQTVYHSSANKQHVQRTNCDCHTSKGTTNVGQGQPWQVHGHIKVKVSCVRGLIKRVNCYAKLVNPHVPRDYCGERSTLFGYTGLPLQTGYIYSCDLKCRRSRSSTTTRISTYIHHVLKHKYSSLMHYKHGVHILHWTTLGNRNVFHTD